MFRRQQAVAQKKPTAQKTEVPSSAIQLFLTLPITIDVAPFGVGGFEANTSMLNLGGWGETPRQAVLDMLRNNDYNSTDDNRGLYFPNREAQEKMVDGLLATHAKKTTWQIQGYIHPSPISVSVTTVSPVKEEHWSERLVKLGARVDGTSTR